MKARISFSLIAIIIITLIYFVNCSGDDGLDGSFMKSDCVKCHGVSNPKYDMTYPISGYNDSAHKNGPRVGEVVGGNVISYGEFEGSNAMYCNAGGCEKCHTHEGFVKYVADVTASTIVNGAATPQTDSTGAAKPTGFTAATEIGCFSCHDPHGLYDFSLRSTKAVLLVDATTSYDAGKGNLCVVCHMSRTAASSFLTTDVSKSISTNVGAHHGPQGEFLYGINSATQNGTKSVHAISNSCVSCHKDAKPAAGTRASVNEQISGHGFYLTAEVHGALVDATYACTSCHSTATWINSAGTAVTTGIKFKNINKMAATDLDGDTKVETLLLEIEGMRNTLLTYFSVPAVVGKAAVIVSKGTTAGLTGVYNVDWGFQTGYLTAAHLKAFWNFKYFIEDKSNGVHNPVFAAELLYDAITDLNTNAAAGLTIGGR